MRADGHGVEPICGVLREQGLAVAPRSYRAWKALLACARFRSDAAVLDKLRHVRTGGPKGRPLPEVLYGRRKMTAWLARNGFPDISKHTVDRLMRDEGMNGLIRGRHTRTTIPAKTGAIRATDLLNRCFSSPRPNHASSYGRGVSCSGSNADTVLVRARTAARTLSSPSVTSWPTRPTWPSRSDRPCPEQVGLCAVTATSAVPRPCYGWSGASSIRRACRCMSCQPSVCSDSLRLTPSSV